MRYKKPCIYIYYYGANDTYILTEICAGLEEEGVLYEAVRQNDADSKLLAYNAAAVSVLQTGVGVTADSAALQMKNLPKERPVFYITKADRLAYRNLGKNAARAVKGGAFVCLS